MRPCQVGLPLPDYALLLLMKRRVTDLSVSRQFIPAQNWSTIWEQDGLIGTRYDIGNSSDSHARIWLANERSRGMKADDSCS